MLSTGVFGDKETVLFLASFLTKIKLWKKIPIKGRMPSNFFKNKKGRIEGWAKMSKKDLITMIEYLQEKQKAIN